jgi:CheY-like chemotaxis protein
MSEPAVLPRPLRVLVADDDRAAADCLAELARLWGHDAQAVYDGPEALSAADSFRPDVVLLDIVMPLMDGVEVAQALRRRPGGQALVVAITGYDLAWATGRGRGLFDRSLLKPAMPDELQQFLAAAPRLAEV